MHKTTAQIANEALFKVANTHYRSKEAAFTTGDLATLREKLQPGDILLTKPSAGASNLFSKAIALISGSPWTHSGMYVGNNTVYHMYPKIVKKETTGDHAMRTHKVTTLDSIGRDILAVRPKASKKVRTEAVANMAKYKDVTYSPIDLLRAGFMPGDRREAGTPVPSQLDTAICSGVLAAAYPTLDFREGKSFRHVRPADFATSKDTKPIGTYQQKEAARLNMLSGYLLGSEIDSKVKKGGDRMHKTASRIADEALHKVAQEELNMHYGIYNRDTRTPEQTAKINAWLQKLDTEVGAGDNTYDERLGVFEAANPWPETMDYADITGYAYK